MKINKDIIYWEIGEIGRPVIKQWLIPWNKMHWALRGQDTVHLSARIKPFPSRCTYNLLRTRKKLRIYSQFRTWNKLRACARTPDLQSDRTHAYSLQRCLYCAWMLKRILPDPVPWVPDGHNVQDELAPADHRMVDVSIGCEPVKWAHGYHVALSLHVWNLHAHSSGHERAAGFSSRFERRIQALG
jgi:hypothetical protein